VLLPVFRAEYGNRLYLGSSRVSVGFGGGVHLVNSRRWTWDLGLGVGERRREERADTLAGMGDRRAELWAGTGLHVRQGPFRAGLTLAAGLGDGAGTRGTLSAGFAGRLAPRWSGGVDLTATASDAKHMAYAFGVDPQQAARRTQLLAEGDPRLRPGEDRPYTPAAGLQEVALGAHLAWVMDRHWRGFGLVRLARLQDTAKQSPLVREDSNATVGLGFSYRF
jgi:outer membrane scaffolding protein for murein synthesis (MipA/OmpV family)